MVMQLAQKTLTSIMRLARLYFIKVQMMVKRG